MFTKAKVMGRDEKVHDYLGQYGTGGVGKTTL